MSKRKQTFLHLLNGKEKTSLAIQQLTNTVASGSTIADLRKMGCHVICRFLRKTSTGAMVYGYTLLSFPEGLYGVGG